MESLIEALCQRYQVGDAYARAYLQYWNSTGKSPLADPSDLASLEPPECMWFDFAMSANWRGRELAKGLGIFKAPPSSRFLDIGCGFGGTLVAFAELGYEVHGMDLDPLRIQLAGENLNSIPESERGELVSASVLDRDLLRMLGKFDLITCIDVIEHVTDVDAVLATAVDLLKEGGRFYLEIPNKDAIAFVRSDGHFALPGITQLPRWAAIEYQQANFAFNYDVGDYYPVRFYKRALERLGMQVSHRPSPLQPIARVDEVTLQAKGFLEAGVQQIIDQGQRVPDGIRPYLFAGVHAFSEALRCFLESPDTSTSARAEFCDRFGHLFWIVSAVKDRS